jgi:Plasmid pRiA4b ORF-3-like protein
MDGNTKLRWKKFCLRILKRRMRVAWMEKITAPPEDCGGIFGYYDLLKAISNPKHPEHQQLLEWLGRPFDPNHFDLQETNAMLRDLKI